jgi:hypothetical protein
MGGREKELLNRIRELEDQNSALQDKLDMIWAVLAPDYEEPDEHAADDEEDDGRDSQKLVQIDQPGKKS